MTLTRRGPARACERRNVRDALQQCRPGGAQLAEYGSPALWIGSTSNSFRQLDGHMNRLDVLEKEAGHLRHERAEGILAEAHEISDSACFAVTAAHAQFSDARTEYETKFSPLRRSMKHFGVRTRRYLRENVEPCKLRLAQAKSVFERSSLLRERVEALLVDEDELLGTHSTIDPLYRRSVTRSVRSYRADSSVVSSRPELAWSQCGLGCADEWPQYGEAADTADEDAEGEQEPRWVQEGAAGTLGRCSISPTCTEKTQAGTTPDSSKTTSLTSTA